MKPDNQFHIGPKQKQARRDVITITGRLYFYYSADKFMSDSTSASHGVMILIRYYQRPILRCFSRKRLCPFINGDMLHSNYVFD